MANDVLPDGRYEAALGPLVDVEDVDPRECRRGLPGPGRSHKKYGAGDRWSFEFFETEDVGQELVLGGGWKAADMVVFTVDADMNIFFDRDHLDIQAVVGFGHVLDIEEISESGSEIVDDLRFSIFAVDGRCFDDRAFTRGLRVSQEFLESAYLGFKLLDAEARDLRFL